MLRKLSQLEFLFLLTSFSRASIPVSTRPHQAELHRRQPGLIRQTFYINANQASLGRAPHRRQPGLIGQSFYTNSNQALSDRAPPTPTRPYQAELRNDDNQALSGRAPPTPTRPYQAELLHQRQPGFIGQSSTPTPTRPHWAELLHQLQPGLIGQSFHINADQA